MADVTGHDVAAFLGRGDDTTLVALAEQHVEIIKAMTRSYTRGQGFDALDTPYDDVAAVITTAAARLVNNPELNRSETIGGYAVQPGAFLGWTLAETFVLNRYRKRSQ